MPNGRRPRKAAAAFAPELHDGFSYVLKHSIDGDASAWRHVLTSACCVYSYTSDQE